MATTEDNIEEELTPEEVDEMEQEAEEDSEEREEDSTDLREELTEEYGSPIPEEKHNQWTTINKALGLQDTVRTTFLTESELGRPTFSVRFLMNMHDDALYALNNDLFIMGYEPKEANLIANYFWDKLQNVTGSGMSNKGFTMNLNVTQKRDTTRKKIREINTKEVKK